MHTSTSGRSRTSTQDLRDALAAARDRETSVTGIRVLGVHRGVEIADEQKNLVCQDTGIAVYYTASASTSRCTLRGSARH